MPRLFFLKKKKKKSLFCVGCILRAAAFSVLLSQTVEFPVRKGKLFLFTYFRLCHPYALLSFAQCFTKSKLHITVLLLHVCNICISLGLLPSPTEKTASQAVIKLWVKQELLCFAGRLGKLGFLKIGHAE